MPETIHIIKIGGKVAENEETLAHFLDEFHAFEGNKILVHGGGVMASTMSRKLGLEPKMIEGRRVTDRETLDVATMVYAGLINKNVVAKLQARGQNAIGVTGADLNLISSKKRNPEPIDFGWVGDIENVNGDWFKALVEQGVVPVVAPLTHDGKGHLLNTNADSMAAHLASELAGKSSVELTFCFEQPGVMKEGEVVPYLSTGLYNQFKEDKVVTDGMIPKLDLGFYALSSGVKQVRIKQFSDLNNHSTGTLLTQ